MKHDDGNINNKLPSDPDSGEPAVPAADFADKGADRGRRSEILENPDTRAKVYGKRSGLITGTGFVAAMMILVLIGWFGYRNLTGMRDATDRVAHTYQVIVKLDELFTDLLDAETGQRGFIIMGNQEYLEPYNSALGQVDQDLATLKNLTADKPGQQKRLAEIEAKVREKFSDLRTSIEIRKTEGLQAAQARVLTRHGMMLMDTIRVLIAEVANVEQVLLKERITQQKSKTAQLNRLLLAGALLVDAQQASAADRRG
jgi:CHASE3 domain sensor protein